MNDSEKWRLIFVFSLLGLIAVLSAVIAIGKVTAEESFGLQYLLGALSGGFGAGCGWLFSAKGQP
jgi:uncharacterized membrane protein